MINKSEFPGKNSDIILNEFNNYTSAGKKPFVIDLEKCHDSFLVTVDGQEILDFENHYASKIIAYNHPGYFEPEYVKKLLYAANNKTANPDHVTSEIVAYYRLLHEIAPKCMKDKGNIDIMCFNSGAEAVENAMKYCVALWYEKNENNPFPSLEKPCFIFFDKAFHGRSVYTLGVTDMPHAEHVTKYYKNLIMDNIQLPFPAIGENDDYELFENECLKKLEKTLKKHSTKIAGIITESMQGASGHRVAKSSFFQKMIVLAKKYNVSVIFDEVQVAAGPTGNIFMCDSFDLPYPPEVICTAKKFGCGVVYFLNPLKTFGILDSTWSGSLVDMVRFVQEMKIVKREKLIEQVPEKSKILIKGLMNIQLKHPNIFFNVRGMGLYQGFSIKNNLRNLFVKTALEKENLLLMYAGIDSVRLRPNLSVSKKEIYYLLEKLDKLLCYIQ